MSGRTVIPISAHPHVGKISEADYFRLYRQSLDEPDRFWAAHGKRIPMRFVLNCASTETLTVLRGTRVVATLRTTTRTAGRASLTWNGRIKGRRAPRGADKIVLRAVSPAGASARDAATLRIG